MNKSQRLYPDAGYTVYATRINGQKVIVSESRAKVDLRAFKELLVMRSEEFDDTTRLTQFKLP